MHTFMTIAPEDERARTRWFTPRNRGSSPHLRRVEKERTLFNRLRSFGAVLIVLVTLAAGASVTAQDATPEVVEPVVTGDPVIREFADFGIMDEATLPASPASLLLFRLELAPGASVAFPPGDPSLGAHLVESGSLTLRNFSTDIVVTRAVSQTTPDAEMAETLPAGAETQLGPGDGFLWTPLAAGEFRNDGTEPVMLAIANVIPSMAFQPAPDNEGATPAP